MAQRLFVDLCHDRAHPPGIEEKHGVEAVDRHLAPCHLFQCGIVDGRPPAERKLAGEHRVHFVG